MSIKNYRLILFILFLVCKTPVSVAQHDSTLCELGGVATIKMPGKAMKQEIDNQTIYISKFGQFNYEAEVSLNSYLDDPSYDDHELYQSYQKIIDNKVRHNNGKLMKEETFFMEGFIGKHFIFNTRHVSDFPNLWYGKLMILNNYSILVTIGGYKDKEDDLIWAKEDYFGTYRLIGDRENIRQTNQDIRKRKKDPPENYSNPDETEAPLEEQQGGKLDKDIDRIFGKILLLAACIVGALIIFLVIYFIYQRKKRN